MKNGKIRGTAAPVRARSGRFKSSEPAIGGSLEPTLCASSCSVESIRNLRQVADMAATRQNLNLLSRLVDDALQLAIGLNENMTAYILSIASREVSERIEKVEATQPAEPE